MKKIILLFVLFFCFASSVYATDYENYNTSYSLSFDESSLDLTTSVDSSNHNLSELLNSLTIIDSEYYYQYISASNSGVSVYLIPIDSYSYLNYSFYGYNSLLSGVNASFIGSSQSVNLCRINLDFESANIFNSSNYLSILDYLDNGGCTLSSSYFLSYIESYNSQYHFSNTESYNISNNISLPYFSNIPLLLSQDVYRPVSSSFANYYFKKIIINDETYSFGDVLPTYYDLFIGGSSFPINTSLEDLYISSIPKSELSNFHIDLSFNSFTPDYSSKIYFNANYFGRINHNNEYYTYEKIDCSDALSSWAIDNTEYIGRIYYNGLACSSDLTNYDNIYIKIQTIPREDNFNRTLYNLSLSSNYGSIYGLPNSVGSFYGIDLFEDFTNLSNTFSILLSSNRNYSRYYSISDNENIFVSMLSKDGLTSSTNNILYESTFGTNNNLSLLLYNLSSYYNGLTNLKLFVDRDTMISLSDTYSYYYYDSNGSISNDIISPNDLNITIDNSYDISYYFGIVNSYINSLETDLLEFHNVVQGVYNIIPQPYNTCIFVLFILSCLFLLFSLIKR